MPGRRAQCSPRAGGMHLAEMVVNIARDLDAPAKAVLRAAIFVTGGIPEGPLWCRGELDMDARRVVREFEDLGAAGQARQQHPQFSLWIQLIGSGGRQPCRL